MVVNWNQLAVAVAGRMEFERLCGRGKLMDEGLFVRTCMEFVQATTPDIITPELNHPDIPGATRLDVVGQKTEDGPYSFVTEAKWVRPPRTGPDNRDWMGEIVRDILRLEHVTTGVNVHTERAILIGGINRTLTARIVEKQINVGDGQPRRPVFGDVLQARDPAQSFPQNQTRFGVRDCNSRVRSLFRGSGPGTRLPVSYQCALAGHHKAGPTQESVEVYVWLIRRSKKRSSFDPAATWT